MAQFLHYQDQTYPVVRHETGTKGSFHIEIDGVREALMTYSVAHNAANGPDRIIIDHTEVSEKLRGLGAGKKLVMAAVDYARETKKTILPLCPFAHSVFVKTPEIRDVWE